MTSSPSFSPAHHASATRPSELSAHWRTHASLLTLGAVCAATLGCGAEPSKDEQPPAFQWTPPPSSPGTPQTPPPTTPPPIPAGGEGFAQIVACLQFQGSLVAECQDDFVSQYYTDTGRTSLGMLDDLEAARRINSTVENACHPMAHAIGRWVYQTTNSIVESFEQCNEACHSGCYHGVMERVFEGETDHPTYEEVAAKMPTICDPADFPTPALEFQCLHGVGHAVMYSLMYDLDKSLQVCDLIPTGGGPASCHGAVFMENINAAVPELRDLDSEDPHYPCNRVEDKYARTCYGMQTTVMFTIGLTAEEIAEECKTGAGAYSGTCMTSLGRDLSNYARINQSERLRHICEDLTGEFARDCVWGGIAALMDNTWDGSFAIPFCNVLHGESLRNTCYYQTYYHLKRQYLFDDTMWAEQCSLYAGDANMTMCLAQSPTP